MRYLNQPATIHPLPVLVEGASCFVLTSPTPAGVEGQAFVYPIGADIEAHPEVVTRAFLVDIDGARRGNPGL